MGDLQELERKIQERLRSAELDRRLEGEHKRVRQLTLQHRQRRFRALADRLLRHHIRPRLERLTRPFPNAGPVHAEEAGPNRCVYVFQPTAEFQAGGQLELAVHHDLEVERLFLVYRFHLLSVALPSSMEDRLVRPLDRVDERQLAEWIEAHLLGALDLCLRVQLRQSSLGRLRVCA